MHIPISPYLLGTRLEVLEIEKSISSFLEQINFLPVRESISVLSEDRKCLKSLKVCST
jgi:hypothetical protein